ncbi:MAG: MBL fold metallo-hydrolase [Flavobacteriaceae bacterium]
MHRLANSKRLLFCFSLMISASVLSQQKQVKISSIQITDQIYMLKGQGGNIGLFVGEDAVFMIDDQFASLTPKILAAIKEITPKKVNYLINTHWHGDHTGGNENMAKEGALIVAHNNVRKRMSLKSLKEGILLDDDKNRALPVITFDKDLSFHSNGDTILATHVYHAHTDGDILIYFTNNNVLHTGDSFFQGKFPYIDVNSGGSIDGYIAAIQKMIMITDDQTKIIPGHGDIAIRKDLESYFLMLSTLRDRVALEIKKGKTIEEVKINSAITQGYESFNGWITEERIRETIYTSLLNH